MTWAYRLVMVVSTPIMWWSRMRVTGVELLPTSGPCLVVANHDSYWDPIAIAVAARMRRQIRALAKSSLWKVRIVGVLMTAMGHIPVDRKASNEQAVDTAVDALRDGVCVGVFPEGTRSLGRPLRARSGAGRIALEVPEAQLVCVRVTGTTDVVRLPRRPRVAVEFFLPSGGQARPGESATELMTRLLEEIREGAPCDIPGRRRTAGRYRATADQ
jgi:1-acyl-sn-glycerol-3-phosphate acyltransferase